MLKETENILRVFNYDAKLALEQYLTACEIDGVKPNNHIVTDLTMYPLELISSYVFAQKQEVENILTKLNLTKNKDYIYDFQTVHPDGFNLYIKPEFVNAYRKNSRQNDG